jgi:solute carrier family 35 (adenosine 3'-phospho 5'-phosphosulfate transporter), member B3
MMEEDRPPQAMKKPGDFFEGLSLPVQFGVLGCGVFFFFGIHNYLQEAMMALPNFKFGVMLGYMEVFG